MHMIGKALYKVWFNHILVNLKNWIQIYSYKTPFCKSGHIIIYRAYSRCHCMASEGAWGWVARASSFEEAGSRAFQNKPILELV